MSRTRDLENFDAVRDHGSMRDADLAGMRVLVVEDEPLLALDIAYLLGDHGVDVVMAASGAEALQLIALETPAAALLDYKIFDGSVEPVCQRLSELGVPFAFLSGADSSPALIWRDAPFISKPAIHSVVIDTLRTLLRRAGTGADR